MKALIGLLLCLPLFSVTMLAKGQVVSPRFQPPEVISTVEPSYPPNAVAGGTVVLKVTVSPNGEIENVHVMQDAKGFTQQALEAVHKWKFKPASFNGEPVTASIPVAFSFSQPIVWWNHQGK